MEPILIPASAGNASERQPLDNVACITIAHPDVSLVTALAGGRMLVGQPLTAMCAGKQDPPLCFAVFNEQARDHA